MAVPGAEQSLTEAAKKLSANLKRSKAEETDLQLLVGPEGGFSDYEVKKSLALAHYQGVSLGPRILRTETAALTMLSILQAVAGDLG